MRVAQVVETLSMGGAENLAVNIANTLADQGHESHLIAVQERGPLAERIQSNVKLLCPEFHRASIRNPIRFLGSLRAGRQLLCELVRAENIDVVQTHLPGANFWGLSLARAGACTVIPTIHNNEEFKYGNSDNPLLLFLRKSAYRQMLKDCQGMVAVSEAVRASMLNNLGRPSSDKSKISVVTNAVPVPAPLASGEKLAIRQRFGIAPDDTFVLAAGRFSDQKNFADLLPVTERLRAADSTVRVLVAGDGELRPGLVAASKVGNLSEQLLLPGNVGDLTRVMLAADIFVMTSLWEGLPLVLLEAMAASLPVVAYRIPGVVEVVDIGVTGLTAPVGDVNRLGDLLAELVADPSGRRAMGAAGKDKITREYGFGEMVESLTGIYRQAQQVQV